MKHLYSFRLPLMICAFCILDGAMYAQVVINEYSVSNLTQYIDNHSDYNDWIELYNNGGATVNLTGYYLSDDSLNNTKWMIPSGISISPYSFLRFWASGRNIVEGTSYHTNFSLKQTKNNSEFIMFSNSSGTVIDYLKLKKTQLGHSRGRTTNGAATWGIFTTPTPNASNNTSTSYTRYTDRPDFDMQAGFYTISFSVSITTTDSNCVIRYTTDGTLPTGTSTVYSAPVSITTTKVLKAIAISGTTGVLTSFLEFATYFINANHTLPVISIAGTQLTTLANGNSSLKPLGSFELFGVDKLRKANTYGSFNSHGQDSWALSHRSLDFISRDEMGYNHSIEDKLFNTSPRTNFQRVILRAAGDDNYPADHNPDNAGSAHLRDAFIHNLAVMGGLDLDVRRGTKSIVYLNGQYWGVYDIRENPDEHDFTKYYYGQDKFNLQYIERWGSIWSEYGGQQAQDDWNILYSYIMNNNMANTANFQYVTDRLDVNSLVDYVLVNMFTVCSDWLIWNTGWWRGLDSTGTHLKWGYILWDNDATFGHYINYTGIPNTTPSASPCDPESINGSGSDPDDHIGILLKLTDNPDFYQYYVTRQFDLWNTVFSCDHMLSEFDSTVAVIDPEMTQQAARWSGTYSEWQTNVQQLRNFIIQRCAALTNGFMSCYSVTGPYDLVLDADSDGDGMIKLNSIIINQFPWSGTYFGGIETKLEAIPDTIQNIAFSNWTAGVHTFTPNAGTADVTVSLTASDTIIAHFEQLVYIPLTHYSYGVTVYPAIFNNEITVSYNLPAASSVTVKLFNQLGSEIASFNLSGEYAYQGHHKAKINFGKTRPPAGLYWLEYNAGGYRKSFKIVKAE